MELGLAQCVVLLEIKVQDSCLSRFRFEMSNYSKVVGEAKNRVFPMNARVYTVAQPGGGERGEIPPCAIRGIHFRSELSSTAIFHY